MEGGGGSSEGRHPVLQLIAGMQAVESLRAQNAIAAQSLADQLQLLNAQAQARDIAAQQQFGSSQAEQPGAPAQSRLAAAAASAAAAAAAVASAVSGPDSSSGAGEGAASGVPRVTVPNLPPAPVPAGQRPPLPKAPPKEEEVEEVPRCHLHRKQNKACKYCKAFYQNQEAKTKRLEEQRSAALDKLRHAADNTGKGLGQNDKSPLPNLPLFPQVMLDRIQKSDYYCMNILNAALADVKGIIATEEACDTEIRKETSLEPEPSPYICGVYRMLTLQLTEGQLKTLLAQRQNPFLRCAGFLYVRLGMHHERYWELLSEALMDDDEFVPFPGKGGDTMTIGSFVEMLLIKEKYCDINLPRIPVAQRRIVNKRMVLYGQFRRRYQGNLEVLDRFKDPGVKVEICTPDGDWLPAQSIEAVSDRRHRKTLRVKLAGGEEREVSIGMLICPSSGGSSSDLTRARGRSAEELLVKYEAQQRDAVVASGKDYCKTSGPQMLRVGGVPFVVAVKRKDLETERASDGDEESRKDSRRNGPSLEHQVKMAAIESKYCARVSTERGRSDRDHVDGPERMRLG